MDRFVRVRLVQANAMDLTLFQFDYDLTFAAFFMNSDRTIYGRYGSRSDRKDATKDLSLEGFREALEAALNLHRKYPGNRSALAGKQPRATRFKSPDDFPSLAGKYKPTLDYEGKVVQSCMHCHQIRDAERRFFRDDRKPIPDAVLYSWPMPQAVGLKLDPKAKAKVVGVEAGSPAGSAGFKAGDEIQMLEGQPILSTADVQWVLQNAAQPATVNATVVRGKKKVKLALDLTRKDAKLAEDDLGLRVKHVGQYGEHAVAKRAGFQQDDIVVSVDGNLRRLSEGQLLARLVQTRMPGEKLPVTVLRAGERVTMELPMQ